LGVEGGVGLGGTGGGVGTARVANVEDVESFWTSVSLVPAARGLADKKYLFICESTV
jgi:hypothetical protein